MSAEELVVGAAVVLIFALTVWRVVLQFLIVKLFLRRLFGRYK
jgi:hypothetical protein